MTRVCSGLFDLKSEVEVSIATEGDGRMDQSFILKR